MARYEPIGDRRDKEGRCTFCGFEGPLSKTHCPPKAALNDGNAGHLVLVRADDGSAALRRSRTNPGGAWSYLLCSDCNNATSEYDEYYSEFVRAVMFDFVEPLVLSGEADDEADVFLEIEYFRPGAIVRSVLACCLAPNEILANALPSLVQSVLTGEPVEWPEHLVLKLAIGADGKTGYSANGDGRVRQFQFRPKSQLLWTPRTSGAFELKRGPWAVVSSPPFLWFLGLREDIDQMPKSMSVGDWVIDGATNRRHTDLWLQVIGLNGASASPTAPSLAYEDMVNVDIGEMRERLSEPT